MVESLKLQYLESLLSPNRKDLFKGKSIEWFKEYGSKMCESTAFRTKTDCRGLVATVVELHKDDYWKQMNPDWNEFCLEIFGESADWVDVILEGVILLHLKNPKIVEKPIPKKVIPLVKKGEIGNGRNKSRSYPVTPTRGNSREYLYRKIARDFPEVIENDEIGENKKYETPYMAAKALGIVKRSPRIELKAVENVAKKIKEKMGKDYAIKLSKELLK